MLPQIDNTDIFHFNPAYCFIDTQNTSTDNVKFFLEYIATGGKIQTDETGKRIIDMLPSSPEKIVETANSTSSYLSPQLVHFYLLLFWKAGVLTRESISIIDNSKQNDKETIITHPYSTDRSLRISVVIVTFFGKKFIRQNLESVYAQTLPADEVIVVDNASKDETLDIIRDNFPNTTVIKNPVNYHYAKAVNIGVKSSSGDLVIILNQDLVLEKDFIEKLHLRYLAEEDKNKAAAIVPQMRFNKMRTFINGIGNFITEKNWGSDNYFCVVDIGQFDSLKYVGSACFGAVMVTRSGWEAIGPLDEINRSFYEDTDWSIRVHLGGMKILAAPQAIVYHEFGGSYPSGLKLKLVARNRMRFVLKHLKGKALKLYFTKYLKQDIKNVLSFLRSRSYRNIYYYMMAYLRLTADLPGIFRYRSRNKHDEEFIAHFFTKAAPYVALGNKELNPVIDLYTIRSYYYFTQQEGFVYPTEPIVYI